MAERAVRIAVLGGGLIGRQHAARVAAEPLAALVGVVDPAPSGEFGVPCYAEFDDLLRVDRPDAVIVATPNRLHVAHGLAAIAAGIAALVEKPLADDVEGAQRLVEAAERAGVPLLVGHHRRHNPRLQAAKRAIEAGRLGTIVAAHATCWFHKPPGYFAPDWRRSAGAGPILINLVHDLDMMRFLCGEVAEVQAMASQARRGLAVEDTASVLLRFRSGALGTLTVSDTIASPWSWEFTAGENPAYSQTPELFMMIGGTKASLALPTLDLWAHAGEPDWMTPIHRERLEATDADPLALQVRNLCEVVRGRAAPVAPGREGLETVRVILAIKLAAATGLAQAV